LDDGGLIGSGILYGIDPSRAVHISAEKAAEIGRASDKDVARLQSLIDRLKQHYGEAAVPEPAPVPLGPPPKKPRIDGALAAAPIGGYEWVSKCREVLQKVLSALGRDRAVFYDPVNPQILPDYYRVIQKPIFLGQVEKKLIQRQYDSPQGFYDDVHQHWINVKLYNPVGDPFRKIGEKVEEQFEQWWAATGYATERAKRTTAGMAAPKFDPEETKPKPSRSAGAKRPARANGHEATSGKEDRPLSQERKGQIATFLQELPEEHTEHLMSLLPPELLASVESGELELDFDNLDEGTLRKIDGWMCALNPGDAPPESPQDTANNPSVRVDSDSDEDYQEDDDSDSD